METLHITTERGVNIVEVRQGNAPDIKPPVKLNISGNIDSPLRFLEKRIDHIEQKATYVMVERSEMKITMVVNDKDYYSDTITGSLSFNPAYKEWGINGGKTWTAQQLSEAIKMNRSQFESIDVAMRLSKELSDVKIKVDKEIERSDNNRGDFKAMAAQKIIKSNIPESFTLNIPIFNGLPSKRFTVEVYVSPHDFTCSLVSPEVNDIVYLVRDTAIDNQLDGIKTIAPDTVIIER